MDSRPLVGISACTQPVREDGMAFHAAADPYVAAVSEGAGCEPVLLPALGAPHPGLIARLDGLLLTGSRSNIEPARYGAEQGAGTAGPHDPRRDATTLPLIRAALAAGLPLLAICRGLQELNVALGGTLHARVQEVPGKADHRNPEGVPLDEAFAPAHPVVLVSGGMLARLAGDTCAMVNSLHGQGIDRLAPGLTVEATAPDGLIEAVRVEGAPFALAVQWHPEWRFAETPLSRAILAAFGAAARRHADQRYSKKSYQPCS